MNGLTKQADDARQRTQLDQRALAIQGVVGVASTDKNIVIYCENDDAAKRAQSSLGSNVGGIEVKYEISGRPQTQ